MSFDVLAPGKLGPMKVFAALPAKQNGQIDNRPDGMCLDEEDHVWAACPFSNSVIRISPAGEIVARLSSDLGRPYACVFGGEDRRDLYICCAPDHDPAAVRAARAGAIAVAPMAVAGGGIP